MRRASARRTLGANPQGTIDNIKKRQYRADPCPSFFCLQEIAGEGALAHGDPMNEKAMEIKHPKRRGEWAEMRFMAAAAEHGLSVMKP